MKNHKLKWFLKEKRGFWVTEALSAASETLELSFIPLFFVQYKAGHLHRKVSIINWGRSHNGRPLIKPQLCSALYSLFQTCVFCSHKGSDKEASTLQLFQEKQIHVYILWLRKEREKGIHTQEHAETMHACTCSLEKCFNYAQKKVLNKRGN